MAPIQFVCHVEDAKRRKRRSAQSFLCRVFWCFHEDIVKNCVRACTTPARSMKSRRQNVRFAVECDSAEMPLATHSI
jgi:hypothetical protein